MVNAITRVCARGGSIHGRRVAFGFKAEDNYVERMSESQGPGDNVPRPGNNSR